MEESIDSEKVCLDLEHSISEVLDSVKAMNIPSLVLASMMLVEKYKSSGSKLRGKDKLKIAKIMLPRMVEIAILTGKVSKEHGDELKEEIENAGSLIDSLVESYLLLSKNPLFLQAEELIMKGCMNLCGKKEEDRTVPLKVSYKRSRGTHRNRK